VVPSTASRFLISFIRAVAARPARPARTNRVSASARACSWRQGRAVAVFQTMRPARTAGLVGLRFQRNVPTAGQNFAFAVFRAQGCLSARDGENDAQQAVKLAACFPRAPRIVFGMSARIRNRRWLRFPSVVCSAVGPARGRYHRRSGRGAISNGVQSCSNGFGHGGLPFLGKGGYALGRQGIYNRKYPRAEPHDGSSIRRRPSQQMGQVVALWIRRYAVSH